MELFSNLIDKHSIEPQWACEKSSSMYWAFRLRLLWARALFTVTAIKSLGHQAGQVTRSISSCWRRKPRKRILLLSERLGSFVWKSLVDWQPWKCSSVCPVPVAAHPMLWKWTLEVQSLTWRRTLFFEPTTSRMPVVYKEQTSEVLVFNI